MSTWKSGRRILRERIQATTRPLDAFVREIASRPITRVPGTAVFMSGSASRVPPALRHNLEHNQVLHEQVIVVTVTTEQVPHVPQDARIDIEPLGNGVYRVRVHYGFMQEPDIPAALRQARTMGLAIDPERATYFLGRETIIATGRPGMAPWRERLFALMSRNATSATAYFGLPPDRVVELGEQVEI